MNTSLLHKEGIDLLVEETVVNNQLNESLNKINEDTELHLSIDLGKDDIIELRNESIIHLLSDENDATTIITNRIGKYAFAKKVPLREAIKCVFMLNMVLGTKYSLKDIFKNAELIHTEDSCDRFKELKFASANLEVLNKFKDVVTKYVSYCHDCLFDELYDKETLSKYLPIVYFLLSADTY